VTYASSARRPPPGSHPGQFVVPKDAYPTRIRAVVYDADRIEDRAIESAEELAAAAAAPGVTWIVVVGLGDGRVLHWIRVALDVHPLAVADLANVPQRPKYEDYGQRDLIVSQHVEIDERGAVEFQQVSLIAAREWVVSVVERPCPAFEPVRERLRSGAPIRRMGADYLAYALLDAVIDDYFPVVETLGELLDQLEEEIVEHPAQSALPRLHTARRALLALHRTMWRQRDALAQMLRVGDEDPFGEAVRVYLRDAHDHTLQVLDAVETYRELAVSLMDLYLSSVSNRLNEVMKTLTIVATIFIPLTFIVGVYGMNFEYMPELQRRWGYPAVWGVILVVSAGLLLWFRRRGWLGGDDAPRKAGSSKERPGKE
jgi:magnesium transporter